MSGLPGLRQLLIVSLIMSSSDMLLLQYLCNDSWLEVPKKKMWGLWFVLSLLTLIGAQLIFSGQTNAQANFLIFYIIHFLVLLFYSRKCTDAPLRARFYLVILSVLANDVCVILLIVLLRSIIGFDYIDAGTFPERMIAHAVLLLMKIGTTVLIKKYTKKQVYGIESLIQAIIIMLPAIPYFCLRNYAFLFKISPKDVPLSVHYFDVLCGIFALINMILGEQLSYRIRQNDLLRVENLVKKQYDRYLYALKSIETVNRKYHDLRHILRGIESMTTVPEIKTYVKTLEEEIQGYELIFNTGNKTLDIILSEKAQESIEKGAQVHVHADGQGWDVVRDTDIATIFGNALDNAIEGTENLGDTHSRLIEIRVGRVNDMLIARFENPYEHDLIKRQSRFLSTKPDSDEHGYGLQSIEMVVKKYGGEMDINTDNGTFVLSVIIPFAHGS